MPDERFDGAKRERRGEMDKGLQIIILEDVATDVELVARELRTANLVCTLTRVDTQEAFLDALEKLRPDLILADYSLPSFEGRTEKQWVSLPPSKG